MLLDVYNSEYQINQVNYEEDKADPPAESEKADAPAEEAKDKEKSE